LAVATRGGIILWPKNVNQMMRYSAAFRGAGLGGANIKATLELCRIAGHHFTAELLRELYA
jgi:hypothetical protein